MTATIAAASARLDHLEVGQVIPYGGNRVAIVDADLAAAFAPGDRIVVDPSTGEILHISQADHDTVAASVTQAVDAFAALGACTDDQITRFFHEFAQRLADDESFAEIAAANAGDLAAARQRGRSTTRLELTPTMRSDMVAGLRGWADQPAARDRLEQRIDHDGWSIEARRAPLGVVGFVFEGRPNVFADAAGVVRTGNTVVFRIGSDALGTARAIVDHALTPALVSAGLPVGTVGLIDASAHAAGWALFSDPRLSLAVARGSGRAVAQLGAVARQAGVPVSLHGTGGAWMILADDADPDRVAAAVRHSLDRKVCNTLNTCCVVADGADELVPIVVDAVLAAGEARGSGARIHATASALGAISDQDRDRRVTVDRSDGAHDEAFITPTKDLSHEWEWENSPEITLHVVASVDDAIAAYNQHSPRFVVSLISESPDQHQRFANLVDAPFIGDGFTRWVDGQYALNTPELGLSNWEGGRMLGRGGILSGDSVYTVRYRAHITDNDLHR
ncbi:MAG: glutamate-5-semialdehyde dehydrogenase [Ilumatobacter coccineus]|uniref:Glutamate-5-semialdehyde dehydrogenase n=1 Tax=Ilumatobacter coccineus TaxID=467094 RepID=A0A2G6KGP9_9ACTN|nr:MAG: glutamate-5-semialdehyde dehydrogenase [Ilumatobacter coccineus]